MTQTNNIPSNRFSVIATIHNCEKNLDNFIRSLVNQSIGQEGFEIILIDRESSDTSLNICNKWKEEHPTLIEVHEAGDCSNAEAKNFGMSKAIGVWFTFPNSNDLLERDYLSDIEQAMNEHPDCELFSGSCRSYYKSTGDILLDHPLSFRYLNGNSKVNVHEDPNSIITQSDTSFVKASLVDEHNLEFCEKATACVEDTLFLNQYTIRTNNPLRCFVESAHYFKRHKTNKATKCELQNPSIDTHSDQLEYGLLSLLKESNQQHTHTHQYLENTTIYVLSKLWDHFNKKKDSNGKPPKYSASRFFELMRELMVYIPSDRIRNYQTTQIPESIRIVMTYLRNESWEANRTATLVKSDKDNHQIVLNYVTNPKYDGQVEINGEVVKAIFRKDTPIRILNKTIAFNRTETIQLSTKFYDHFKKLNFALGHRELVIFSRGNRMPHPVSHRNLYKMQKSD